jgi:hypothetical protein
MKSTKQQKDLFSDVRPSNGYGMKQDLTGSYHYRNAKIA